jgi:hypothetical protein
VAVGDNDGGRSRGIHGGRLEGRLGLEMQSSLRSSGAGRCSRRWR